MKNAAEARAQLVIVPRHRALRMNAVAQTIIIILQPAIASVHQARAVCARQQAGITAARLCRQYAAQP